MSTDIKGTSVDHANGGDERSLSRRNILLAGSTLAAR